jgi:hypothetical protein
VWVLEMSSQLKGLELCGSCPPARPGMTGRGCSYWSAGRCTAQAHPAIVLALEAAPLCTTLPRHLPPVKPSQRAFWRRLLERPLKSNDERGLMRLQVGAGPASKRHRGGAKGKMGKGAP